MPATKEEKHAPHFGGREFPPSDIDRGDDRDPPFEFRPEHRQRIFDWVKRSELGGADGYKTLGIDVVGFVLDSEHIKRVHVELPTIPDDPREVISGKATVSMHWVFSENSPNWSAFESAVRMSAIGAFDLWRAAGIEAVERFRALDNSQIMDALLHAVMLWGSRDRKEGAFEAHYLRGELEQFRETIQQGIQRVVPKEKLSFAALQFEASGSCTSGVDKVTYNPGLLGISVDPMERKSGPWGHTIKMHGSVPLQYSLPRYEFLQNKESHLLFDQLDPEQQRAVFSFFCELVEGEIAGEVVAGTEVEIEYIGSHIPASQTSPEEYPEINSVSISPERLEISIPDLESFEPPIEEIGAILGSIPLDLLSKYKPLIEIPAKLTGVYQECVTGIIPLTFLAVKFSEQKLKVECFFDPVDV